MSDPTELFVELVSSPDHEVRLDQGALLIAAHVRPGLELGAWYAHLDDLAYRCPEPSFSALCRHLFEAEGFGGNTRDYSDPENSMLDSVLTTRVGLPITLSVVAIEVGRRLDVVVTGVGMPGHFIIGDGARPGAFCDPFHGGRVLDVGDCEELFDTVHGATRRFDVDTDLASVSSRAILARMLANLEHGPLATDPLHLAWMCRAHLAIPGLSPGDRLALAQRLATLDVWRAADEFDRVADVADEQVAAKLRAEARRLRARRELSDHVFNGTRDAGESREVPMFPLGSVLFPYALLPLHVFEPRYRMMVRSLLQGDGEFGVVLIERGSEVGGGDVRFDVGTLARVVQASETPDGRYAVVAVGVRRLRVTRWLDDDPYPRAEVWLPAESSGADAAEARERACRAVKELVEVWATVEPRAAEIDLAVDDDPVRASYELAGHAPIGPLDAQRVLAADGVGERLALIESMVREQTELLRARIDRPD